MSLPSWYTSISPGQWGTLPNSTLTGSGVDETNAYQIILAWGGGWLNTFGIYNGTTFIAGTFVMLGPSGGHTDSGLDAVYAYGPLENNSPQWYRVRSSTVPNPQNVVVDGNGNPVSRHTYAGYAPLPGFSKFIACGAFRYTDAGNPGESVFDLNLSNPDGAGVQPWSQPTQASTGTANKLHDDIQIAQADSANGVVWAWSSTGGGNGNCVGFFNPSTGTWSASGFKSPLVNSSSNTSSCIDVVRGIWMMWFQGSLQWYETGNGVSNDYYAPSVTGTAPTIGTTSGSGLGGNGSMLYDPVDDQCIVWANSGQSLWALKPPATSPYQGGNPWTWSSITVGGSTPGPENGTAASGSGFPGEPSTACNGTYGRFGLDYDSGSGRRGYFLLNRTSQSIYYFRPASTSSIVLGNQTITSTEGTLARAVSLALTGQTATFTEGTLTASGSVAHSLTGQSVTLTEGTLSAGTSHALAGQSMTATEGALTAAVAAALTAQSASFTQGTITASVAGNVTTSLAGQTATFTEGTISAQAGGNVSKSLTALQSVFSAGTIVATVPNTVLVPNVVGLPWVEASQVLIANNFNQTQAPVQVRVKYATPGTVLEQFPSSGSAVDAETNVQLTIASGYVLAATFDVIPLFL